MGSFIAKEVKETLALGQATTKPASAQNTTTTEGTNTDTSKEDKEEKKKPGLTDEEWETIRSLSNPFS
jgi:hypothetical protein